MRRRLGRQCLGAQLAVAVLVVGCGDDSNGEAPSEEPLAPLSPPCVLVGQGYGPAGTTPVDVVPVATGLEVPWGVDFLPNGDVLATERSGRIIRIDTSNALTVVATVTLAATTMEGGLLGLAVHPQFEDNRYFYVYYTTLVEGEARNLVERWVLAADGQSAAPDRVILEGIPALQFHNGGRLRFGPDGYLYVGTGDAGVPETAQDPYSPAGKILRIADDGAIPSDNPFPGLATWVYGIRNTQGFDWRDDGYLIVTDHGPSGLPYEGGRTGHDEINVVTPGANLGWPSHYACEDGGSDLVSPSMTWVEPMPPGGAAIYTGDEIPDWRGDVFIGVLGVGGAIGHLHRIRLDEGGNVTLSETYFMGDERFGRIRDVAMGPNGGLYLTTSRCDGRGDCGTGDAIYRVVPK